MRCKVDQLGSIISKILTNYPPFGNKSRDNHHCCCYYCRRASKSKTPHKYSCTSAGRLSKVLLSYCFSKDFHYLQYIRRNEMWYDHEQNIYENKWLTFDTDSWWFQIQWRFVVFFQVAFWKLEIMETTKHFYFYIGF